MKKKTKKKSTAKRSPTIGYKKVLVLHKGQYPTGYARDMCRAIVTLSIPARARIIAVRGHGGKRRCDVARVLAVTRLYLPAAHGFFLRPRASDRFMSSHEHWQGRPFFYRVGATVKPRHAFDTRKTKQCASGIHFFLSRAKAENYGN